MESTFRNVPQMFVDLSEKSAKLIRDNAKEPPQGEEWFKLIKEMAQKIADGEFTSRASTSSRESQKQFSSSTIPSYVSLITGEAEKSSLRVSANLPARKRDHLHGKKSANVSGRKTDLLKDKGSNLAASKTSHTGGKKNSLRVSSKFDGTNAMNSRRASTRGKENSANLENISVSSSSSNIMPLRNASTRGKKVSNKVEDESDCIIIENPPASEMHPGLDRTFVQTNSGNQFATPSSKSKGTPLGVRSGRLSSRSSRKLSKINSLEQEMFLKKLKGTSAHSHEARLVTRSSRFSMGKKKYSGLREARQPSALGTRSSKTTSAVKKEVLQCKEDLAAENLKKIQDARRIKMEEKKKQRDEKMERTKEKRMQLEKAKTLSSKKKTAESVTRSTRAQEKNNEKVTRSREPKAAEAIAKTSQAKRKTPASSETKNPKKAATSKTPALSKSNTPTSPKAAASRTPDSSKSKTSTSPKSSPLKATPAKSRRPTPPMKNQELKVTPLIISLKKAKPTSNQCAVSLQDTTITVSKKTKSNDSMKKTPTSPPVPKAISKLKEEAMSASGQKETKSSSPSSSKKLKLETTASTPKAQTSKKPDSYELTPDRTSLVSYDMSEIKSDDDEEEESTTTKPIPSWALGLRLRNALIHQYYNPIDTDELFGSVCDAPDLEQMFNIKKNAYNKRTSSAIWQSPGAFR